MKAIIFVIIMFFMSSTLGASTSSYTISKVDRISSSLFSIKAKGFTDLEFKLGMSEGLKRLEYGYQKNSNLLEKVVVWMSFKF